METARGRLVGGYHDTIIITRLSLCFMSASKPDFDQFEAWNVLGNGVGGMRVDVHSFPRSHWIEILLEMPATLYSNRKSRTTSIDIDKDTRKSELLQSSKETNFNSTMHLLQSPLTILLALSFSILAFAAEGSLNVRVSIPYIPHTPLQSNPKHHTNNFTPSNAKYASPKTTYAIFPANHVVTTSSVHWRMGEKQLWGIVPRVENCCRIIIKCNFLDCGVMEGRFYGG